MNSSFSREIPLAVVIGKTEKKWKIKMLSYWTHKQLQLVIVFYYMFQLFRRRFPRFDANRFLSEVSQFSHRNRKYVRYKFICQSTSIVWICFGKEPERKKRKFLHYVVDQIARYNHEAFVLITDRSFNFIGLDGCQKWVQRKLIQRDGFILLIIVF